MTTPTTYIRPTLQAPPVGLSPSQASPDLLALLRRFDPIGLAQMDHVALLDRNDTKFALTLPQLIDTLPGLTNDYLALDINGLRLSAYQTLYFDAPDFALYLSHHHERRRRYKVRGRHYASTDRSFLEVKYKTGASSTAKRRLETRRLATWITPELNNFVHEAGCSTREARTLEPKLFNNYSRITLVNKHQPERVTLDLYLEYIGNGQAVTLPGIVIAEIKRAGLNQDSAFIHHRQAAGLHPTGFSKYCIGVSILYPDVKHNNFKPQLLLINRLQRQSDPAAIALPPVLSRMAMASIH